MLEAIIVAVVVEIILFIISLIIAIPLIKQELKTLNSTVAKSTKIQEELVKTVIRMEERLNNHIHDTNLHKQ